jgi:RNase P/RNase MRP subunit p29
MPWPDLFFKSRKPKPVIETVPVSPPAPTEADKKREKENNVLAQEKADSLRALTESGSTPPASRGPKESSGSGSAKEGLNPADVKTSRIEMPPLRADGGGTRSGTVSLRQRAKLTEDARVLPKSEPAPEEKPAPADSSKKPDEPPAPDDKPAQAAVVPAAFPVAVETGSVMDKTADKKDGITPPTEIKSSEEKPVEAKAVEVQATVDSPIDSASAKPETATSAPATPSRETTHVHLGDTTPGSSATALEPAKAGADTREKQEFILANGERIFGHILSETPQTIYLDHGTLGVLTLPRSQIAKKPIEVILINGDRIVGDLIAETPDCLYIKHASLGMLTVPHGQRSTRVVEAIMKDGDRILGEVLAETDNFTVIRSATLGTVAVQHEQVAMLNRKIEQMQLRTLPPSAPVLEDKPKA